MKSSQEIIDILGSEDPFKIFAEWLPTAKSTTTIKEPTAMLLSTCQKDFPSSRIVLLKEFKNGEFIFFTNYLSDKGQQLSTNPKAALTFYWDPLARQCRIQGLVHPADRKTSEDYWKSRPRDSQLSQWISHQSEVAESRDQLESLVQEAKTKFDGREIPCPEHWGGYVLIPQNIEFWIGRANRLHDRFVFKKQDQEWISLRLFP